MSVSDRVRAFLAAVEAGATGDTLAAFYAPGVIQEEFPNRLLPNGARRDLAELLAGAERGQKVLRSQAYEVLNLLEQDAMAVVECRWMGVLAIPIGALAAGDAMTARFCQVFEFDDDGRILAQRNYDCFDPF